MSEDDKTDNTPPPESTEAQTSTVEESKAESEATDNRTALIRLLAVVAAIFVGASLFGFAKTALVLFVIAAMIIIHELGHFLVAKATGMKVEEFFIGFGRRLWSVRKGETEYGIKLIPAGGYVKIAGMSNLDEVGAHEEDRTYRQKPYWRRLSVVLAGPVTHFVMAFLIFLVLVTGPGLLRSTPVIGEIQTLPNNVPGPAQVAGLQVGDRVTAVDGQSVSTWEQIPSMVCRKVNEPVVLSIVRGNQNLDVLVTPVDRRVLAETDPPGCPGVPPGAPVGLVGVSTKTEAERLGPIEGASRAASTTVEVGWMVLQRLGDIFSPSGLQEYARIVAGTSEKTELEQAEYRFSSPPGIADKADEAANAGLREVLSLLFVFNMSVGVLNLLPLLPFDGGHAAVATYERIRSRKGKRYTADYKKLIPVTYAVFAVLAVIGLTALYLDIVRPLPNIYE